MPVRQSRIEFRICHQASQDLAGWPRTPCSDSINFLTYVLNMNIYGIRARIHYDKDINGQGA